MISYDNKGFSYDSKREVVNREPPVTKHIVEKLYRVHRTNVLKTEAVTDCHIHIPEFLTNQSWKKLGEIKKKKDQEKQNEIFYERLSKMENSQSRLRKDIQEHINRVEDVRSKMLKLSEAGRLKRLMKIQKDNAVILDRIEKARPSLTKEAIKEWYKPHILYKDGRRSDITAGHIMKGMSDITPKKLPPIKPVLGLKSSYLSASSLSLELDNSEDGSIASVRTFPSRDRLTPLQYSPTHSAPYTTPSPKDIFSPIRVDSSGPRQNRKSSQGINSRTSPLVSGRESELSAKKLAWRSLTEEESAGMFGAGGGGGGLSNEGYSEAQSNGDANSVSSGNARGDDESVASNEEGKLDDVTVDIKSDSFVEDLQLISLVSRPFPLPNDTKNCTVSISIRDPPDECFHIVVQTFSEPNILLGERIIHVDRAKQILLSTSNMAQHAAQNDDLQSLRTVLINMFLEADDDKNGFLTFDEFQVLLEKVDLGISPQEMRFVISEADENENGVVDYHEFVPLAVDMIQSFRARNKAKSQTLHEEAQIDEMIRASMSSAELDSITNLCMERLKDIDVKGFGVMRANDIRRCLNSIDSDRINEKEVTMIVQQLPRDAFGRCVYGSLRNVIENIRFLTLKNTYMEVKGSDLHKYLLDKCREEESKIRAKRLSPMDDIETGQLPFRSLTNLLQSSRLSLSRLQVMVIMAEASVQEGMVDYYQFCPVAARTIELMFEPRSLRQRAELIEKIDLSPESLLSGLSTQEFSQKLSTLFKSYDIDKNGVLDAKEFQSCLLALDFNLSEGEVAALRVGADLHQSNDMSFDDFVTFFTSNLLHLEREKHINLLQQNLHARNKLQTAAEAFAKDVSQSKNIPSSGVDYYRNHLETIFSLADFTNNGFIDRHEFEQLIKSLDIRISKFQLECILSELSTNEKGCVDYKAFIPICADILTAYKAKEMAEAEREANEDWARRKAQSIIKSSMNDINYTVRYIKDRVCLIEDTIEDSVTRMATIHEIIRNPHSGLSRTEANSLISKLFTLEAISSRSQHSFRKIINKTGAHNPPFLSNSAIASAVAMGTAAKVGGMDALSSQLNDPLETSKHEETGENVLTTQELRSAVMSIREASIMRSLLEDANPESLEPKLLQLAERELLRINSSDRNLLRQSSDAMIFNAAAAATIASAKTSSSASSSSSASLAFSSSSSSAAAPPLLARSNSSSVFGTYLPLSSIYNILGNLTLCQLNKTQIMAIVSWLDADCFDSTATQVDYAKFCSFAAAIISKMRNPEEMDDRAQILDQADLSDEALLLNLTEKDLHDYLVLTFTSIQQANETVSTEKFIEVIEGIPKLGLTRKDAATVLASFPHSAENNITWKEFLPWSHSTILHLLREREIARILIQRKEIERLKAEAVERRQELQLLAERLIDHVKIKQVSDILTIFLPGDNSKRSSVMKNRLLSPKSGRVLRTESSRNIEEVEQTETEVDDHILQLIRVAKLMKCYYAPLIGPSIVNQSLNTLPLTTQSNREPGQLRGRLSRAGSTINSFGAHTVMQPSDSTEGGATGAIGAGASSAASTTAPGASTFSSPSQVETTQPVIPNKRKSGTLIPTMKPVLIRIIAVASNAQSSERDLYANIISVNSEFAESAPLPVKLPSIGLVDSEAAEIFAMNLIERMHIELPNPQNFGRDMTRPRLILNI